jgi:hypothetical protein
MRRIAVWIHALRRSRLSAQVSLRITILMGLVASSATFSPETGPPPNLSLHSSSNGFVPALGFKAFKLLQQLISLCRKFGEAFDVAFSLQVTGLFETLGVLVLKFFQGFFDRLTDEGR